MEGLLKLLGVTTPLIYATAIYGLFHWLDENASDEAKAALSRTMKFRDYKNEQIASALVEIFDRIYTHPLLAWRAFFRSFLFTTAVSGIWLYEIGLSAARASLALPSGAEPNLSYFLIGFLFNAFSDYLSLFVIRSMLIRTSAKPVIGLALGTLSGVAIVSAVSTPRLIFFTIFAIKEADGAFLFGPVPGMVGRLMLSWHTWFFALPAMTVLVWLPLLALGIVVIRVLTPLSWIVARTQWFLKGGQEHPLKAIGYVAAGVAFLGTVAGRAAFSA